MIQLFIFWIISTADHDKEIHKHIDEIRKICTIVSRQFYLKLS